MKRHLRFWLDTTFHPIEGLF